MQLDIIHKEIITSNFSLNSGISCIRIGHILDLERLDVVIGTQTGELKLLIWNSQENQWDSHKEFDLTENGAIWNIELIDINKDGLDEIIIGGMQGAVICLTGKGDEVWVQRFSSAISGIKIWPKNIKEDQNDSANYPRIVVFSLDRTVRVFDPLGKLLWAQMFASGVGCVDINDCDGDGHTEIIAGGNDGTVRIFEGETGKIKWFKEFHQNVRSIITRDTSIICGGDDRLITIFNGQNQQQILQKAFPCFIWNIRLGSKNHPRIFISTYSFKFLGAEEEGMGDPQIGLFNIQNLDSIWEHSNVNAQDSMIIYVENESFSSDYILIGDTNGCLMLFSLKEGSLLFKEQLPNIINAVNHLHIIESKSGHFLLLLACDDSLLYTIKIQLK